MASPWCGGAACGGAACGDVEVASGRCKGFGAQRVRGCGGVGGAAAGWESTGGEVSARRRTWRVGGSGGREGIQGWGHRGGWKAAGE